MAAAQETLALALPGPFDVDERLNEVSDQQPVGGVVRPARRAWLTGMLDERHDGWGLPTAAARFDAAVRAGTSEGIVVASHGMFMRGWSQPGPSIRATKLHDSGIN